jgi:hypothetical protein
MDDFKLQIMRNNINENFEDLSLEEIAKYAMAFLKKSKQIAGTRGRSKSIFNILYLADMTEKEFEVAKLLHKQTNKFFYDSDIIMVFKMHMDDYTRLMKGKK